jgi:hypothetical protein
VTDLAGAQLSPADLCRNNSRSGCPGLRRTAATRFCTGTSVTLQVPTARSRSEAGSSPIKTHNRLTRSVRRTRATSTSRPRSDSGVAGLYRRDPAPCRISPRGASGSHAEITTTADSPGRETLRALRAGPPDHLPLPRLRLPQPPSAKALASPRGTRRGTMRARLTI